MDVFVGPSAARILRKLSENSSDHTVIFAGNQTLQITQVVAYPFPELPQQEKYRMRYNCAGEEIGYDVDRCSFNGLLARVLFRAGINMDVFPFYEAAAPSGSTAPQDADAPTCNQTGGRRFCQYVPVQMGKELGRTDACMCGG